VFSGTLKGIDRPGLVMKIDAFALAFNVVLGFALVYEIGPIGVVLATVLAEASRYALLAYLINERFGDVRLVPRPLMEQFAAGMIMFLVVESSSRLVTGASWFNTALLVGIGGAVYMGVLFAISANFRVTVRSLYRDSGLGS
jgi:peptidoglycan biosynthesis protein MviN/MurJ (putative lipid II flippase)